MVTVEVHSTTSNRKISPSCMPSYGRDHCSILSWSYWKITQSDIFPPSISLSNTFRIYCDIRVDSPRQVIVVNEHKYNAACRGSVFSTQERNSSKSQIDVKQCQMFTEKKNFPSFCQSPCLLFLIEAQDTAHAEAKKACSTDMENSYFRFQRS